MDSVGVWPPAQKAGVSGHFGSEETCSDPIVHSLVSETRKLTSKLCVTSGTTCQSGAQLTLIGFLLSAPP